MVLILSAPVVLIDELMKFYARTFLNQSAAKAKAE
jgi:hypothetical protein